MFMGSEIKTAKKIKPFYYLTTLCEITKHVKFFVYCFLRWPNTVCARFTDSVSDAIKRALGLW